MNCSRWNSARQIIVEGTATYVFRPDGHVLARCTGIDAGFARQAIRGVLNYRVGQQGSKAVMPSSTGKLTQLEIDRLYDALAALADDAKDRERALARLVVALAERVGDYGKVQEAIKTVVGAGGSEPLVVDEHDPAA